MIKIVRITTVAASLKTLLKGQLKFVKQHGYEVLAVSSDGIELDHVAVDEGVRVAKIEMTRQISPLKDLVS